MQIRSSTSILQKNLALCIGIPYNPIIEQLPEKNMVQRELSPAIQAAAKKMPVIAITGPRQSGKTTLAKALFPEYDYLNIEFPDVRARLAEDPRFFLKTQKKGLIIDEVHRLPELFSYIQGMVDEDGRKGQFILTGSHNFLLMKGISQSLAGRAALFHLLPFTLSEISSKFPVADDFSQLAFTGTYPRIYDQQLDPRDWYPSYISAYIERDVRLLENIRDLHKFHAFIRLCAGRIGQVFNASAMGNEIGVSYKTVQAWVSILEASFILFLLQPYHKNFNKRLTKSPKLYFYDTGLVCSLLGIRSAEELSSHYLRGELFECLVIADLKKRLVNMNSQAELFFWRDSSGNEIDCLIDFGVRQKAVEIKSSTTVNPAFFKNLTFWQKLTGAAPEDCFLIYGGAETQHWPGAQVTSWKKLQPLTE